MRRIVLQLLAALILWAGVFALFLAFGAGGLTLYFEVPPEAGGMSFRCEPEGVVRLTGSSISEDGAELAAHFEPEAQGTAEVTLHLDSIGEDSLYAEEIPFRLRSLPFGILFDSITWNFTGWEYLTACFSLFLLTAALVFLSASRRERKHAFFSYRSTAELGLAIFLMLTAFFRFDMILPFLRGENAGTVWSLLVGVTVSAQTFMRWTAAVLGGFSLVAAVSNAVLIRHEGFRPANMLGIFVALLIVGGAAFVIWVSYSLLIFPMRNLLLNVFAGIFVYLECLLAATVIHAFRAGRHEPEYDLDYVVVLGCRIRPDGTLYPLIRGRVDRAISFLQTQEAKTGKRAVLVPSGGKGPDEPEAEAEAMARYMLQQGIPAEQILVENRSTTTLENLRFSRELIRAHSDGSAEKAAFSTSSYHVYRGGILAAESGWNIDGMGSHTRWYFWPNAFLREFVGLLAASRIQQISAVLIIALLSAALTALIM